MDGYFEAIEMTDEQVELARKVLKDTGTACKSAIELVEAILAEADK